MADLELTAGDLEMVWERTEQQDRLIMVVLTKSGRAKVADWRGGVHNHRPAVAVHLSDSKARGTK